MHSRYLFFLFMSLSAVSLIWLIALSPNLSHRNLISNSSQVTASVMPCNADVLICPDGVVLHRQGSDCHFPTCPTAHPTPLMTRPMVTKMMTPTTLSDITLFTPLPGSWVHFPLLVQGNIKEATQSVSIKLIDKTGKVFISKTIKPIQQTPSEPAMFMATLSAKLNLTSADLVVCEVGVKPNPQTELTIPLLFQNSTPSPMMKY